MVDGYCWDACEAYETGFASVECGGTCCAPGDCAAAWGYCDSWCDPEYDRAVPSSECGADVCCVWSDGDCADVGGECAASCTAPRSALASPTLECGAASCCVRMDDCDLAGGTCRTECAALESFVPSAQCGTEVCCVSLADDCERFGGRCADPGCGEPEAYVYPSASCPSRICCG